MTDRLKTIRDVHDWQGKRALVRVDFNVPVSEDGKVTEDYRMQESLPTIQYLAGHGAKVILMSHLGRPKGERNAKYSLHPVFRHLETLLPGVKLHFSEDVASERVNDIISAMRPGEVLLLENTRFEPGEEKNDAELSRRLADLGDIYVNDAFGAAHRAHASTEGVAAMLPVRVAGLLMEKEHEALSALLRNAERPFTAIIGGSKISTKITVLESLLKRVDTLVIGGGMIFTFLKAQGYLTGGSLVEDEYLDTAKTLLEQAKNQNVQVLLAGDIVVADAFKADAAHRVVGSHEIPDNMMGLDIGPKTILAIQEVLTQSRTVLWNGPMGVFEFPAFAQGTKEVAATIAELTEQGQLKSVLGGGDTIAALDQYGFEHDRFTHVSTGGGASLEFIEGKTLPGIAVLERISSPARV